MHNSQADNLNVLSIKIRGFSTNRKLNHGCVQYECRMHVMKIRNRGHLDNPVGLLQLLSM